MTTCVIFEARANPQQLQPLLAFLRNHLPDTRNYEGCLGVTLYLGDDWQTVVMVEQWQSGAHYRRYLEWRRDTGLLGEMSTMLVDEPRIRFFEAVDS